MDRGQLVDALTADAHGLAESLCSFAIRRCPARPRFVLSLLAGPVVMGTFSSPSAPPTVRTSVHDPYTRLCAAQAMVRQQRVIGAGASPHGLLKWIVTLSVWLLLVVVAFPDAPTVVDPALPMIAWFADDDELDGDSAHSLPRHPVALTSPRLCLAPPAFDAPISVPGRAATERVAIAAQTPRAPPGATRWSRAAGMFALAALPVLGDGPVMT
jgi:hypothetical protein